MEKQSKSKLFIVNFITSLRILLSPIVLYLILLGRTPNILVALILFIIGAVSDAFDGFLARKYKVQTKFGFILDPIADKFLVLGALLAFSLLDYLKIPFYFFLIILVRDILVSSLKPISDMKGFPIPTTFLAKAKTTLQFIGIMIIFLYILFINSLSLTSFEEIYKKIHIWAYIPFWITLTLVIITVISGLEYIYLFILGHTKVRKIVNK